MLLLAVVGTLVRHEPKPHGDDLIYELIALHPFAIHTFPFAYRIGLPLLVHVFPTSTSTAFVLAAWLAAGGAAAYGFLLMIRLGSAPRVAAMLAILMCVSPPFLVVVIREGRNTDIATVLFLMAATYYLVTNQYGKLAIAILLGVFVREALLFAIPLAYTVWAQRPLDFRAAARALTIGCPALIAYACLRLGLHTVGKAQVPGYSGSLLGGRVDVIEQGLKTPLVEFRRAASVYGPLWLAAPLALPRMRFARRGLTLVALSLVSMTFALDWGRMLLLSASVIYPAAGFVLTQKPRWANVTLATFAIFSAGYAIYMTVYGVQHGIIDTGAPPYPVR